MTAKGKGNSTPNLIVSIQGQFQGLRVIGEMVKSPAGREVREAKRLHNETLKTIRRQFLANRKGVLWSQALGLNSSHTPSQTKPQSLQLLKRTTTAHSRIK